LCLDGRPAYLTARMIIYGFTSRWWIFHLYEDVTIADGGLQNLGPCSAFRALEQWGIFIVSHHLLWHGTSVFPVSSEGPPHLVAFTTHMRMWSVYSNPDPHGSPFSRLLHTQGNSNLVPYGDSVWKTVLSEQSVWWSISPLRVINSFHVLFVGGRPDRIRVPEGDVIPVLKAHYGVI
jgi:hypothetical protein